MNHRVGASAQHMGSSPLCSSVCWYATQVFTLSHRRFDPDLDHDPKVSCGIFGSYVDRHWCVSRIVTPTLWHGRFDPYIHDALTEGTRAYDQRVTGLTNPDGYALAA